MKKRFLKGKASLMALIIICATFSIYLMNPVSAADNRCCEKTKSGEYCLYTDASNCDLNVRSDNAASTCDQTSYCQVGCCQDQVGGTCFKSTPLAKCNALTGKFFSDATCAVSDCKKGCCVISGSCSYVTEKKCDALIKNYPNIPKDFRDISSELECSNICRGTDQGCCKTTDKCVFTSRDACSADNGDFSNGEVCSEISSCGCTKHYTKGCYDDDVYWFDSCGNREDKFQDCDYGAGTICGKNTNGDFTCKSVNCETTYKDDKNVHDSNMGGLRKNGESWCVYESATGDYLDRPGTRQYRHMCVNGEEIVEPCRDYREEICVQSKVKDYTEAQCIRNEIYNSEVTSNISTVPIGFKFWQDKGNCQSADQTCKVVYVKSSRFASWKCEQNCQCETPQYVDNMNKYCKSMGDCGANVNILGVKSESGFSVSGNSKAPRKISNTAWTNYSSYGVFGGMKFLSEQFKRLSEANVDISNGLLGLGGLAEGVIAGAVAYGIMLGIATLVPSVGTFLGTVTSLCFSSGACLTPAGIIVLVVVIIFFLIFGGSETKTYYVITKCTPWQAPDGGKDCSKCRNDNKFKMLGIDDCTEYKCRSLGKLCEFIPENEGSSRISCYNKNPNDVNSPVISPWPEALPQGYTLSLMDYGYLISPKIKPFTRVSFGIKTDELAQCKISETHTNTFDEMSNYLGDSYFTMEHNITLNLAGGTDYAYYVRCKDASGNANSREYTIKLSTETLPDITPPIIEGFDPADGSYISANLTQATVNILLNEPSTCKFSTADKDYDAMEETASCDLDVHNSTFILNYDCYAMFNITSGTNTANTVYFRCMDLKNNKNQESTPYSLITSGPLVILYSAPSGTLFDTNSPTLEVTTAGGSQNGVAECRFSTSQLDFEHMISFFKTNSANHKQNLMNLSRGDYVYYVQCRDSAGNEASTTLNFRIDADTIPPQIVYIYSDGSTLHIILDEPSTCEYSNTSFAYGNGTKMTGLGTSEQTAPVGVPYYYINCVDKYNNAMGEIIVYPQKALNN